MSQDTGDIIKITAAAATAFAAILTAFYVVIMRPLVGLLQAKILAEVKATFSDLQSNVKSEFTSVRSEIKVEFTNLRSEMKLEFAAVRGEMAAMEKRLNDRIDTYVIRH
jgi:hypothetical protein